MQTLNISLPRTLAIKVDELVEKEEYASRSEFFRTLLRFYLQLTARKAKTASFFIPFRKKPLAYIEKELKATNLYQEKFIKSVIQGLAKSSIYANKTA